MIRNFLIGASAASLGLGFCVMAAQAAPLSVGKTTVEKTNASPIVPVRMKKKNRMRHHTGMKSGASMRGGNPTAPGGASSSSGNGSSGTK